MAWVAAGLQAYQEFAKGDESQEIPKEGNKGGGGSGTQLRASGPVNVGNISVFGDVEGGDFRARSNPSLARSTGMTPEQLREFSYFNQSNMGAGNGMGLDFGWVRGQSLLIAGVVGGGLLLTVMMRRKRK